MEKTQGKKNGTSSSNGSNRATNGRGTNGKTSSSSKATNGKSSQTKSENDSMLGELFHDQLKDIYWAEKHLLKELPKMEKAATAEELKTALNEHLEVTREHVSRLEEVFGILGHKPQAKKCEAMEGLTKEGESIIEETEKGTSTRDVGIILAAQKVEHYEIATYGGLAQLARTLQYEEVAEILGTTLAEEKEADETLTEIAENNINAEATAETE